MNVICFQGRGHVYILSPQANRPQSYAILTTPYINTTGKCLQMFYFPIGTHFDNTGYIRLIIRPEDRQEQELSTTRNDISKNKTISAVSTEIIFVLMYFKHIMIC